MAEHCSDNTPQAAIMCLFCNQPNVKWKCEECGHMCNACKEKVHNRLTSSHKHTISYLKDIGKISSSMLDDTEKISRYQKQFETDIDNKVQNICFEDQPWYHGNITRNEAVKLLQKHKRMGDGAFLVRESRSNIGSFAIDCMVSGEPRHVQIQPKEKSGQMKYYVGEEPFDGLNDVIEFFKSNVIVLSTTGPTTCIVRLTEPVLQETYM